MDKYMIKVCVDGLVQECIISIANAREILQFCTKPSMRPINTE